MVPHRVGIRIRPLLAAAVLTITGTDGVALASTSPERDAPRTVPEWESTSAEGRRLLQRWAPVLHQLVDRAGDHSEDGRADLPARIDYDGDWNPRNNWDHLPDYPLTGAAYVSWVRSETHDFLLYAFYHPRDWTNRRISPRFLDSEHENDLEAFLAVVRRTRDEDGILEGGFVVHHDRMLPLVVAGSGWIARSGTARTLHVSAHAGVTRPVLVQEACGHGLLPWPDVGARDRRRTPEPTDPNVATSNQVVYYPADSTAGISEPRPQDRDASYRLIDIFEEHGIWSRRADPALFRGSRFVGDCSGGCGAGLRSCEEDKAAAPWGLGEPPGEIASDPARFVERHCHVPAPFSHRYLRNPYR